MWYNKFECLLKYIKWVMGLDFGNYMESKVGHICILNLDKRKTNLHFFNFDWDSILWI